jgi:hypothetical protein
MRVQPLHCESSLASLNESRAVMPHAVARHSRALRLSRRRTTRTTAVAACRCAGEDAGEGERLAAPGSERSERPLMSEREERVRQASAGTLHAKHQVELRT